MPDNPNLAVQERFVAAVFAGDTATIQTLAASGFELLEGSGLPFAGTYRGAEGFIEFLGIFTATFEIERLAPVRSFVSDDPDRLAFEFELRGIHRASGDVFESSLVELWHFRSGQVVSIKAHCFNVPGGG
jgi:ketosteroid isomerase-like protein